MENRINLDKATGNVILQDVDVKGNLTINTISFDEFVNRFTQQQNERIIELKSLIKIQSENKDLLNEKILKLSDELTAIINDKEKIENQVKNLLEHFDKSDFSKASILYQDAFKAFINGKIDEALEILNDDDLDKELQKAQDALIQNSENRIFKAEMLAIKKKTNEAIENFKKAISICSTYSSHFRYAYFLSENYQYHEAISHYSIALELSTNQADKAGTLNNLALLNNKINQLEVSEQQYKDALSIQKVLAQREIYNLYNVSITLNNLANLHDRIGKYDVVEQEFHEAYLVNSSIVHLNPPAFLPHLASILDNWAAFNIKKSEFNEGEKKLMEALSIRKSLLELDSDMHSEKLGLTLNLLGDLYRKTQKYELSEQKYKEALVIFEDLSNQNPSSFLEQLSLVLTNFGILNFSMNKTVEAEQKTLKAIEICRGLSKLNPDTYSINLIGNLQNLGDYYRDLHRFEDARLKLEEALQLCRNLRVKHPNLYKKNLAGILSDLGILFRRNNKFENAENAYSEALNIFRELANTQPKIHLKDLGIILINLTSFYNETENIDKYGDMSEEALNVYRKLVKSYPNGYESILAKALLNRGGYFCKVKEWSDSKYNFEEALKIITKLISSNVDFKVYAQDLADCLMGLAVTQENLGEIENAEYNYNEAVKIFYNLIQQNSNRYLLKLALVFVNLSTFYIKTKEDRNKSIYYSLEVLRIVSSLSLSIPYSQKYVDMSINILEGWGVDVSQVLADMKMESKP